MTVGTARPWIVVVTGEPGSGKTSLGLRLSESLRVPFLSRDHVRGGQLATAGLWTNRLGELPAREEAVGAFVEIVEAFSNVAVSVVVEFVVTPTRLNAFHRVKAAARCLVVLTVAADAPDRAARRDRADPLVNRPEVLAALGHRTIDDYVDGPERQLIRTQMQTDLGLPLLRVSTDHGYEPTLPAIVDWVIEETRS